MKLSPLATKFLNKCQMQADASGVPVHAYVIGAHQYKMVLHGEERPAGRHIGTREPQRWTPLDRIHKAESDIINAQTTTLEIGQSYDKESMRGRSPLLTRNRDSWGTLYVNVRKLQGQLSELVKMMDKEFNTPTLAEHGAAYDANFGENDSNGQA